MTPLFLQSFLSPPCARALPLEAKRSSLSFLSYLATFLPRVGGFFPSLVFLTLCRTPPPMLFLNRWCFEDWSSLSSRQAYGRFPPSQSGPPTSLSLSLPPVLFSSLGLFPRSSKPPRGFSLFQPFSNENECLAVAGFAALCAPS